MAPRKSEDDERLIDWNLTAVLAVEGARRPLPPGAPARVEPRPGGKVVEVAELAPRPREETAQLALPTEKSVSAVKRRLDKKSLLTEIERLVCLRPDSHSRGDACRRERGHARQKRVSDDS